MMGKFITGTGESVAALAAQTAIGLGPVVPVGRQYIVRVFNLLGTTAGAYPCIIPAAANNNGTQFKFVLLSPTASALTSSLVPTKYPAQADVQPGGVPWAVMQPGDQLGAVGNANGLTAGVYAGWELEDVVIPA